MLLELGLRNLEIYKLNPDKFLKVSDLMVIRLQMLLALFGLGLILGCASQPPVLGNGFGVNDLEASDVAADQARLPSFKIDLYCGREG